MSSSLFHARFAPALLALALCPPAPVAAQEPAAPAPIADPAAPAAAPAPVTAPAAVPPAAPPATLPPGYVWVPAPGAPWPMMVAPPAMVPMPELDPTRTAMNALFVEFGGNGLFYTLNYERFLTQDVSARVGLGYLSVRNSAIEGGVSASLTTVPLLINYLGIGEYNHRLELGAGAVFFHLSAPTYDGLGSDFGSGALLAATGSISYRYVPLNGGFNFKAGFTPLLSSFGLLPLVGVSLGAAF